MAKKEKQDVGMALASPSERRLIKATLAGYSPEDLKTPMVLPKLSPSDVYCLLLCTLLGPFAVLVWVFFTFFSLPLLALGGLYVKCFVRAPTERDDSLGFKLLCILTAPYAALLYAFAAGWWWFVFFVVMLFSLPVALFRTIFLCQGKKIINNFRLIWPWMKFNHFSYFMYARAVMGQVHRQGLCEFVFGKGILGGYASNIAYVPIIKYAWSANPLLYILEPVFINQWTPPIKNISAEQLIENTKHFVSRFKHEADERLAIDNVLFAAYYPYGPSLGKQPDSVIGIQYPERSKIINMTNTIHVTKDYTNQFSRPGKNCRSETGECGIYVVQLNWFSYHFVTGYVEVNYRTDKGVEHPMWVVLPKGHYFGTMALKSVNDLFASFVPDVVEYVHIHDEDKGSKA